MAGACALAPGAQGQDAPAPAAPPAAPAPPLGSKAKKFASDILQLYHFLNFSRTAEQEAVRDQAAKKLDKARKDLDGLEKYAWKGLAKALNNTFVPMRKEEDGRLDLSVKIDNESCKFMVAKGKGYTPDRPSPLLIALHGGGLGSGDGGEAMTTMGTHFKPLGALVAAPTAPGLPNGAWAYPRGYRTVFAVIREMGEMYNIDYNRIYVGGHSMGGYGGYWNAVSWPDRFAAHCSCAGGITAGMVCDLEILYNTPLYVVHGTRDEQGLYTYVATADRMIQQLTLKPRAYKFVVLQGVGHGFPSEHHKAASQWMWQHVRDPYPSKVVCTVPRMHNPETDREMLGNEPSGRAFWVEILARAGADFDHPAKVVAEYDSKQNLVTVTTPPIKRVEHPNRDPAHADSRLIDVVNAVTRIGICLSDDMMDLEKPVKVTCNGATVFEGKVTRSVDFLVEKLVETGDPAMPFACRVDFDVPVAAK